MIAYVFAIIVITMTSLLFLLFACITLLVCLYFLCISITGIIRLLGHLVYSIVVLTRGLEHPICGQILEWERDELEKRIQERERRISIQKV